MLWASRKKRTAKTTTNRNFPIPNQMDLRSSGPIVSKSVVIRAASVPAWVLAIMKLIPRTFDQGRILMRLVAGLVALVVRHRPQCLQREDEKQCPQPVLRHHGELIDILLPHDLQGLHRRCDLLGGSHRLHRNGGAVGRARDFSLVPSQLVECV